MRILQSILAAFGADVNLNDLAVRVTQSEGQKKSLSIGQVKEVQRIVLEELSEMDISTVARLLQRISTARKDQG